MRENGQDQLMTLIRMDDPSALIANLDPEIGSPASANLSALAVDWMGFIELMRNPVFRETLKGLPASTEDESTAGYITRIWPLLTDNERGAALDLGLQKMTTVGHISRTGIQVRIWRAYLSGEWQYSPMGENEFRPWVRSVLTDSLSYSPSESSKLATLCEVIGYLAHNIPGDNKLPEDLESCFRRPFYWKWKTLAPKIEQHIEAYNNIPVEEDTPEGKRKEEEAEDAILTEIEALIEAIYNEDLTHQEISDQGRKSAPKMRPITLIENRRLADIHTGIYEITDAQLSYLRKKLGITLDYQLEGEIYDVDQWTMVQYRLKTMRLCTKCGVENLRDYERETCVHCHTWDEFEIVDFWDRRELTPSGEWTDWDNLEEGEPDDKGIFESEFSDQDMGLEYSTYWVKQGEQNGS